MNYDPHLHDSTVCACVDLGLSYCRHCGLLQANIEHGCLPEAYVEAIAPETLVEICEEKFCHCSIQRSGSLLLPPEQIVVEEDVESARARFQRMFDGM